MFHLILYHVQMRITYIVPNKLSLLTYVCFKYSSNLIQWLYKNNTIKLH